MKTPTAVVIEDDPDLTHSISTVLRGAGFTVHAAGSGPEGVDTVQATDPAVVTMDLRLPGFDGQEAIRRIRSFSNVPILIISASNDLTDLQRGLGAGADGYVVKPVSAPILRARIRALLRRPT
uniref:response regulator transcription factor n=1 Tax=Pseudarthrobacter oxydans TaxID=1671 RepID=UPI003F4964EA